MLVCVHHIIYRHPLQARVPAIYACVLAPYYLPISLAQPGHGNAPRDGGKGARVGSWIARTACVPHGLGMARSGGLGGASGAHADVLGGWSQAARAPAIYACVPATYARKAMNLKNRPGAYRQ